MSAKELARWASLLWLVGCADPATLSPPGGDDSVAPNADDSASDDSAEDSTDDSADDSATPKPGYLVVSAPDLLDAANEWAAWRAEVGFEARVVSTTDLVTDPSDTPALVAAVQAELAGMWVDGQPLYLLLVGDAPARRTHSGWAIGALSCENDLNGCYTDNRYGDLDGDGVPEVAIGRIPARTPEQVRAALDRTRDEEEHPTVGDYNRRVVFWAGPTGFDAQLTQIVESVVMQGLASVDPAYEILGIYGDPSSNYYAEPFEERVVGLLNEGASLSVYLGHGSSNESEGLSQAAVDQLDLGTRSPVMTLFACYNGLYAGEAESLAETLFFWDSGPAAVFAAAGETHPYANGVLPYELQSAVLTDTVARIGDAVVAAKHNAFLPADGDNVRELLDLYARAEYGYSPDDLVRLLHQNVDLYNLMGDPALLLQRPASRVTLELGGRWRSGAVTVHGAVPDLDSGTAHLSFEVPRDVLLGHGSWEEAINTVVTSVDVDVEGGEFDAELSFDASELPGDTFYVKVYASNAETDAFGAVESP